MPKKCKNAVYELYELICSANIRDYIKPKYEYLLYAILGWLEDCADSEELFFCLIIYTRRQKSIIITETRNG